VGFSLLGQTFANPQDRPRAALQSITPSYTDTLGIQIVKGRAIDDRDTETSAPVAIVNEHFANRFLPGVDPLTQWIVINEQRPGSPPGKPITYQIIGVFHNVRGAGFREDYSEINLPFWQSPWPRASIALKTDGDPKALIKSVAAAVNSVDPDIPLANVRTVDEIVSDALAIDRFSVVLFASFGALGLLLAAVGIYGVMAFGVAQRTQELGVRLALGAQRSSILALVLKEGTVLAFTGGLIGLAGAYLVGRAMQSTLYGVPKLDFAALGAVFLLLLSSALLACLIPAWRASRIEPLDALRHD
jgi:putative ABC transport system permease protein